MRGEQLPSARVGMLPDLEQTEKRDPTHEIGLGEDLITLAEASKLLPKLAGRRIAICTLWRWCSRGVRGVRLAHLRAGRRIVTSRKALYEFFAALTEVDDHTSSETRSRPRVLKRRPVASRQRRRELDEADRVLAEADI